MEHFALLPRPVLRSLRSLLAIAAWLLPTWWAAAQVATTFNTSGSFTPPAGVTQVVVECWGGGGRGGTRTTNGQGGGGGGGAYSRSLVAVSPGTPYTVTVGAGSTSTAAGGDSWFGTAATVMAKGGNSSGDNSSTGATGGTAGSSIGSVKFSGGNGANGGTIFITSWGGGGGSSAGYAAAGANGAFGTAGTAPTGGGNGGNGASSQGNGTAGNTPGGGGGGAIRSSSGTRTGGSGADGRVVVTYYTAGSCISGTNGFNSIPDNACGASQFMHAPMAVTGLPTTLGTAPGNARLTSVELIVAHTFNSDLRVTLTSPAGTTRNLVLNRFGNGDNLGNPGACPGTVLTLADGGLALVNTNTSNVAGTYQPEQTLAGFTGDPNGAWVLNICDNANSDVGRLVMARLNFCTVPLITSFGSNSPICAGETLTLTSAATGSPAPSFSWAGSGTFAPNNTSANVSVTGAATGNYTVTASSSCGSASQIIPVTVNPLPIITCPASSSVCIDAPVFALTGGSPAGGTYSGPGVSGGNFDPAVAGAGAHTITYSYTDINGCTNTPCTFTITVNALPVMTCPASSSVCIDAPVFALTGGSPAGGTYSGPGVSGGSFDPAAAGSGAHTITYSYTDVNSCTNTCTFTITVNALPVVTCPASSSVCIDAPVFALTGGSPGGGTYSGTGVSGGSFDPAVAGVGSHTITYSYTDVNSCTNTCTFTITVNALPVVSCPANITGVCSADAPFALSGATPVSGTYSGTGVSGGSFDPGVAGAGTHTITYSYTDGNSCSNSCTFTIDVTLATTWYSDLLDGDGLGDPGSPLLACGQPVGYVADNTDGCPAVSGTVGDACNDGNPFTTGDVLNGSCVCAGTPAPCTNWNLAIATDANGGDVSWQLKDANSPFILASGNGLPNNTTVNSSFCVPVGACFELTVSDAGGNGIAGGGWVLTNDQGERVIDNTGNGGCFGSSSTSVNESVCNAMGTDKLMFSDCDKEDHQPGGNVFASENPAVSAQWGIGNPVDDGYQFWFYDPCGGYSRRIFRNHATSGGFGPANAIRATKLALASIVTNPLPQNTLLNVRVRSRVNGVNSDWGPACRFRIATVACPQTKLIDTPNHPNYSCDVTRSFGGSDKVSCFPVAGANKYRFRFENIGEGYLRNVTSNSPTLVLNWLTLPLQNGVSYDVQAQASFDGGLTYCPLGATCVVTILNVPAQGGQRALEVAAGVDELALWPNPTADGAFDLRWSGLPEDASTVELAVIDLSGRVMQQQQLPVADGLLTARIAASTPLSSGLYFVRLTAGELQRTERLVVR